MSTKQFSKISIIIILALSVTVLIAAAIVYTSGPRVRLVSSSTDFETTRLNRNHSLTIHFDRPVYIPQDSFKDLVRVEPSIKFDTAVGLQDITITFQQNLSSNTDYEISLNQDLITAQSKPMRNDFSHTIRTKSPVFSYLTRDKFNDDVIYESDIDGTKRQVFSAPTIRSFVMNQTDIYVALVNGYSSEVYEEEPDTLVHIDRKTGKETELSLPTGSPDSSSGVAIKKMVIAPQGNVMLFTLGLSPQKVSPSVFQYYSDALYSYNTDTKEVVAFRDESKEKLQKVYDFHISNDGQALLVSNQEQVFNVLSTYDDTNIAAIGRFDLTGGFNSGGTKLLFFDSTNTQIYDAATSQKQDVSFTEPTYNAFFKSNSDDIWLARQKFSGSKNISIISEYEQSSAAENEIWNGNGLLQFMTASYDDRYIAYEIRSGACTYDEIEFNGQCEETEIAIIDTENGKELLRVRGINPRWLP